MNEPYYADDLVTLYHGSCIPIPSDPDVEYHPEWMDADVLVTDPPFGYNHSSNWAGKFRGVVIANDASLDARDTVIEQWGERPALVFGSWKREKPAATHSVLIWDKGEAAGMGDLSIPWKPNWEEIYVMGRGFAGPRTTSVLSGHSVVTWASKGREHPNMKPHTLLEALIRKCPPGIIADPFAGSGSTLLAARNLGRESIGVEVEERYCEVIAKRLAQQAFDFGGIA